MPAYLILSRKVDGRNQIVRCVPRTGKFGTQVSMLEQSRKAGYTLSIAYKNKVAPETGWAFNGWRSLRQREIEQIETWAVRYRRA